MNAGPVQAQLRRTKNRLVVKSGEASAIVKQYLSYSLPRKQQFFISYNGKRYSGEDARKLLDQLTDERG
jgi:hypothetical protein